MHILLTLMFNYYPIKIYERSEFRNKKVTVSMQHKMQNAFIEGARATKRKIIHWYVMTSRS